MVYNITCVERVDILASNPAMIVAAIKAGIFLCLTPSIDITAFQTISKKSDTFRFLSGGFLNSLKRSSALSYETLQYPIILLMERPAVSSYGIITSPQSALACHMLVELLKKVKEFEGR